MLANCIPWMSSCFFIPKQMLRDVQDLCEPTLPSFLGVILPMFLGLNTFIFHGFGVQRYIEYHHRIWLFLCLLAGLFCMQLFLNLHINAVIFTPSKTQKKMRYITKLHNGRFSVHLPHFFSPSMKSCTVPETNSSPLKIRHPKRERSYSNHPFSGANC